VAAGACAGGDGGREPQGLEPQFEPVTAEATAEQQSTTTTSTPAAGEPTTIVPAPPDEPTATTATAGEPTTEAVITDRDGDATPSPIDPPPAWSDLLGARLVRSGSGFELRIRLGGGDAPESTPDDDHTMNLASFYDVDGDGSIDYEIWANVASGGWGASYFDNDGGGRFGDESFVTVTTEGDEVVVRFALLHLDGAERFRWSIASEWGRYDAIGTPAMVRDEAPDDDGAAAFPGA
jgi:hypothetical protein